MPNNLLEALLLVVALLIVARLVRNRKKSKHVPGIAPKEAVVSLALSENDALIASGTLQFFLRNRFDLSLNSFYNGQILAALMAGKAYECFPPMGMGKYGIVGFIADPNVAGIFTIYVKYGVPDEALTSEIQRKVRTLMRR